MVVNHIALVFFFLLFYVHFNFSIFFRYSTIFSHFYSPTRQTDSRCRSTLTTDTTTRGVKESSIQTTFFFFSFFQNEEKIMVNLSGFMGFSFLSYSPFFLYYKFLFFSYLVTKNFLNYSLILICLYHLTLI